LADFKPRKSRCTNCAEQYLQTREDHRFCQPKCRWEFHRNGGVSFAKTKYIIEQEVERRVAQAESRLAKKFSDILRKRHMETPDELLALVQDHPGVTVAKI